MTEFWIPIAGLDPSMTNFGIALMHIDLHSQALRVDELILSETKKRANKVVRQNSDDLRRATESRILYHKAIASHGCKFVFSEVPTGAQSARAMFSNGVVTGLLASCPVPLIQVQPSETKMAAVGTNTASKAEMIEWAVENYPDAPWIKHKHKGQMVVGEKNEHLADAVAVVHAGIKTDQFQQVRAMLMATITTAQAA